MRKFKKYLSAPQLTGCELESISKALSSGWLAPRGEALDKFSSELKSYMDSSFVILTQSGTSALHLALDGLGLKRGEFVLCPTFTYVATVNPVKYLGGIPFFVDTDPESYSISAQWLEKSVDFLRSKDIKVRFLIVAHLYGRSVNIPEIQDICKKYDLILIEDFAESMGAMFNNQKLGSFGEASFTSFNGNKIITTTQGGALFTNSNKLFEKTFLLSNHSTINSINFEHESVGYNYRMSNILASMGSAQFQSLESRIQHRRWVYYKYLELIQSHPKFSQSITFIPELENSFSTFWLTTIHLINELCHLKDKIIFTLAENGFESRSVWKPLHLQKPYEENYFLGDLNCLSQYETGICLPSGPDIDESSVQEICEIIFKVLNQP